MNDKWWIAGAVALGGIGLGVLSRIFSTASPTSRHWPASSSITGRVYRIGGRRKSEVHASIHDEGGQFLVMFDYPYGVQDASGQEIDEANYPIDDRLPGLKEAKTHADTEMRRLGYKAVLAWR